MMDQPVLSTARTLASLGVARTGEATGIPCAPGAPVPREPGPALSAGSTF